MSVANTLDCGSTRAPVLASLREIRPFFPVPFVSFVVNPHALA
jgi:hypothetical protein